MKNATTSPLKTSVELSAPPAGPRSARDLEIAKPKTPEDTRALEEKIISARDAELAVLKSHRDQLCVIRHPLNVKLQDLRILREKIAHAESQRRLHAEHAVDRDERFDKMLEHELPHTGYSAAAAIDSWAGVDWLLGFYDRWIANRRKRVEALIPEISAYAKEHGLEYVLEGVDLTVPATA